MLPQSIWFARRGWTVLAVVRRGYGKSGGQPDYMNGRCPQEAYEEAGRQGAEDLNHTIEYGASVPQVDTAHTIAVGLSTGGFATVALTAKAPLGLVAAISFAGGRGVRADFDVCNPGELIAAFRSFGKHSRIPMLWIYAADDRSFWPEIAHKFDDAFRAGGGQDQFVQVPATARAGHGLFFRVAGWSDIVDDFLKAQNLVWLPEPLPSPKTPDEPLPPGLSEAGERAFRHYLLMGPHKAFAMSEHAYHFSFAQMTVDMAKSKALNSCRHAAPKGEKCKVVSIDGASPDEK
jgi:dienelactone hydrolase